MVVIWALSGPYFRYSQAWQIVVNTGTTIITFLMVFLLQNTQARDSTALHLKLNELLRAIAEARTELVSLEKMPDAELEGLRDEFARLADAAQTDDSAAASTNPPASSSGVHDSPSSPTPSTVHAPGTHR